MGRDTLEKMIADRLEWQRTIGAKLKLFDGMRAAKHKTDKMVVFDMLRQIEFRLNMNLTPDNRAALGVCKNLKKHLTNYLK